MKKFLITIVVVVVLAIGALMIWLATLESSYHVKRSIEIDIANEEVFALVQDFNRWHAWSPWLCMDPDAKVEITGKGKNVGDTYSWKGVLVGSGVMKHVKIVEGKSIEQEITFLEPMESQSFIYWEFENVNDSTTKVVWGMKGEMPFFARFMTKMMDPMIGMDYERGLKMLKDKAEKGYVASKIEIEGVVDASGFSYMGERTQAGFEELGIIMKPAFMKVTEYARSQHMSFDKTLTVYHDFDFIKGTSDLTMAVPVKDTSAIVDPFVGGVVSKAKALKIKFIGDYEHVGNAWAAAITYMRIHKLKENKSVPSYEFYLTDPAIEPDTRKWVTEIYVPVNE